jgi:hypothetical protein
MYLFELRTFSRIGVSGLDICSRYSQDDHKKGGGSNGSAFWWVLENMD